MNGGFAQIWVYLAASPLLGLTLTLIAYQLSYLLYRKSGNNPLVNPVLLSVVMIGALLVVTNTSYAVYFDGAKFVHFLLGPATVALAVPLHQHFARLKAAWPALLVGLLAGATVAMASAVLIGSAMHASLQTVISMAPKSVTTPIAMGISQKLGGLPSLTAVLVISTGILGAIMARPVLVGLMHIKEDWIRGFATGIAAHGIGAARAFQVSEECGAFAGLAMGLNGVATALLAPVIVPAMLGWLN
jgi:predicted murein hydrolase (TIGR00659 family)